MTGPGKHSIAVFIDTENVSHGNADFIFRDLTENGTTVIRRAFGDFAGGKPTGWLKNAGKYALDLVQVTSTAPGKNAADIRLVIDAIEILRSMEVDVFCLVSGDGDFTPLAIHLRAAGKVVIGYGGTQSSEHFRQACSRFVCMGQAKEKKSVSASAKTAVVPPEIAGKVPIDDPRLRRLVQRASESLVADARGWFAASQLGSMLRRNDPDFNIKSYGSASLGKALERLSKVELVRRNKALYYKFQPEGTAGKTKEKPMLSVVAH